jgi:uncharacterized membrane protein
MCLFYTARNITSKVCHHKFHICTFNSASVDYNLEICITAMYLISIVSILKVGKWAGYRIFNGYTKRRKLRS